VFTIRTMQGDMVKVKQISGDELLSEVGLIQFLNSGHGHVVGMYRCPTSINGWICYKQHDGGKIKYRSVQQMVAEHFGRRCIVIDAGWFLRALRIARAYNKGLRLCMEELKHHEESSNWQGIKGDFASGFDFGYSEED